jgi:hypothetical protein
MLTDHIKPEIRGSIAKIAGTMRDGLLDAQSHFGSLQ